MYIHKDAPTFLESKGDHVPLKYWVRIAMNPTCRWAEVECSCGKVSRHPALDDLATYRDLVVTAWLTGCGISCAA